MATLREKIGASAEEWLNLPPGVPASKELARYKRFLKIENNRLRLLHNNGAGGLELCRARSFMMDELVRHLVATALSGLEDPALVRKHPVAVVAYGGYGRGELNPLSDVDLLFLHGGEAVVGRRPNALLTAVTDTVLYTFWDLGLKVGHAVRTPDDCVAAANDDMQTKTSYIEARLITGDEKLFRQLQTLLIARAVRGHEEAYIEARLKDQAERRARHGNSPLMQEPNLKNGCGGLRDVQNLIWMAFFKYRCRSLAEIADRGAITGTELKQLEAAYDCLLRVRNDLHYTAGRATDALTRALQAAVAHNLGHTDRAPTARIEKFMRELYTHLRNAYLITRNAEQRLALVPQERRFPRLREVIAARRFVRHQVVDGFKLTPAYIEAPNTRVFQDSPRRLLRVFLLAQQRGLPLHPDLVALIRSSTRLMDRAFLRDEGAHQTFLEILNHKGSAGAILRQMHEMDVLGKYLPEFGRLTCLVQHEFYHQYAADEHTLQCIEALDRVWGSTDPQPARYAALLNALPRPYLLNLALLIHDTGKPAHSGDHTEDGQRIANAVARRIGLDGSAAQALRLLVRHHILMAQVSQRRDLDDPLVIERFVKEVPSREHLDMLTLHTYADSVGTSASLWTGFKDSLLWALHTRAVRFQEGGPESLRQIERDRDREEVRRLAPKTFHRDELDAHFHSLPERYFQVRSPAQIVDDLARVHRFMHQQIDVDDADTSNALKPVITWHHERDRGYAVVHVCTWDRAGLFSKITGALSAAGLNILSAEIFSRADGVILDSFAVVDARTGTLPDRTPRERFEELLEKSLTTGADLHAAILKPRHSYLTSQPLHTGADAGLIPTVIRFDNETSADRTVVDIQTVDRVGLLYFITEALAAAQLNISTARISTENGAAVDSFYVTEIGGAKITGRDRQAEIRHALETALHHR